VSRGEGSPLEQARHALEVGALKRAEYLLKQASNMPGEAQEAILTDLMHLAELWQQSGKSVRAARLYGEVIQRLERLHDIDSPELIEPLRRRATALLETDLPHEQSCEPAEDCWRRALRLQEQHAGPETLEAGWMLLDLTDLLQDHERCDEAEGLARQTWDIGRGYAWDDPALFFEATDWLVWWYEAHQEWGPGQRLLESSLELAADLLGADHPRVAELMGAMANMLLQDDRDVDEADRLCARGLEILARSYGDMPVSTDIWPRSPDELAQIRLIFSSLNSIRAHAAFIRGQPLACHFLLNRALLMLDVPDGEVSAEIRASLAAGHGSTLQAMAHLAIDEGDDAQAERLFQRAMAHSEQGDPDRLAMLLEDYAAWLDDHNRQTEADQARREAEDLRNG
jgi:tetratricopeptide (TPR) repeat protein